MNFDTRKHKLERCRRLVVHPGRGPLAAHVNKDADITAMRESPSSSDFTIHCRGREFKVHKDVLSLRSRYFLRMFQQRYLETVTGKIELQDEDPDAVADMIGYMYSTHFYRVQMPDPTYIAMIDRHVQLCIVADKYEVDGLLHVALNGVRRSFSFCPADDWPSPAALLRIITHVYDSTTERSTLRRIMVESLSQPRYNSLIDSMRERLYESPDFLYDMMKQLRC
ncbi:hypothetical protein SLS55_006995 [Diplodia seriata]|uniref:BTB domain-containing protein n=1 Tax=Diplodia seriata TaxID=420778 RepID=A0ABR3CB25_9PEZI